MNLLKKTTLIAVCGLMPISFTIAADSAPSTAQKEAAQYPADNTGKNKRDADTHELTAQNQSNTKNDVEITRQIRQALMKEKSLSTSAQNVKIIVAKNTVTLKGPVKSSEEKQLIETRAHAAAPHFGIVNELEITK